MYCYIKWKELINNIKKKSKKSHSKNIFKKIFVVILFFICLFISVYSVAKIRKWLKDNKDINETINKINDITDINEIDDEEDVEYIDDEKELSKDSLYWYFVNMPLIDVDLKKLKQENNDTIGWIKVNGTNVNYPFVQTNDNSYYLNHSFDKTKNDAGWVFADYRNDFDILNKNNIIYAHGRLDNTMFGTLKKTLDKKWYTNKDNNVIRVSTEKNNTSWQIFSIYHIPTTNDYIKTFFENNSSFTSFLDTIKNRSIHNFNVNLNENDKILTLSTCYNKKEKLVIHAKLIKIDKK